MLNPVITAKNLSVEYHQGGSLLSPKRHLAVDDVNLSIADGQTLSLVGESGSGKSSVGRALLRLIGRMEGAVSGRVEFHGTDLYGLSARRLRRIRPRFHLVYQDPRSSLDPAMNVRDIVAEALRILPWSQKARQRDVLVERAVESVGLSKKHLSRYPHEFSGGQRQRIAIARAIIGRPELLVLDEPLSALDLSTQAQVLNLLMDLKADLGLTYLFISHDMGVVRQISDYVAVMYLGQIREEGPVERLFDSPSDPYTKALLAAVPKPDPRRQRARERVLIQGTTPDLRRRSSQCLFHTRCPDVMDICRLRAPESHRVEGGGSAACHLLAEVETLRGSGTS